jgi:hypothetical protein
MPNLYIPELTFPKLAYGTHGVAHDLRTLLYCGGAHIRTNYVAGLIANGSMGQPSAERLPLVIKLHEAISAEIAKGKSHATIVGRIKAIRHFYSFCDAKGLELTLTTVGNSYHAWVEALIHRARVARDAKEMSVFRYAADVDQLLSAALDLKFGFRRQTRMRRPKNERGVLGTQADKQNLEETFEFGRMLLDISDALSAETIQGPLPLVIAFRNGNILEEWCGLRPADSLRSLQPDYENPRIKANVLKVRAAYVADTSLTTRFSLVNLRIQTELLIFIAQTGMNLTQARKLTQDEFRYQSDGDDLLLYRVYKGRRGGEADFRIYKDYRPLFERYTAWLKQVIPEIEDRRLFPFVYQHVIPSGHSSVGFNPIKKRCERLGIRYITPRALRKTRINWLLRRNVDPALIAEMAQHTQKTLIRAYQQPNHQVAAREITRFHHLTDPSIAPPGPGACIELRGGPRANIEMPPGAPTPDCVSPGGCLFCEFHRDIESLDYVWSLTSYRYLKATELGRYHPPTKGAPPHPVVAVLDRIAEKLAHFEASSQIGAQWVHEARDRILESRFHPAWDGFIQLTEPSV